jgi:hypothetical protein
MINIVCLKWGSKYGPEYVNRLYAGIKRNTNLEFKFWCFTDNSNGIRSEVNIVPLKYANLLDSWWNKLNLFSNDLPIPKGEWIFYVDLDTLIVNNIDRLLKFRHANLVALKDFYYGIAKTANRVGSGLMAWQHGRYNFIWEDFIHDPKRHVKEAGTYGDQWWIEKKVKNVCYWQEEFPDQVVSFKLHCRKGVPSSKTKIICYHGKPSIPESSVETTILDKTTIVPQPWVLKFWRDGVEPVKVRFAYVRARDIFGMVGRCGGGYNSLWADWSPEGRNKRELVMREYEEELNKICGHYSKLESSILAEGIRNPVVITCGYPKKRSTKHIPPEMLKMPESSLLLLEGTTGGSRLHIAQKYDMTIPCFINDWTGRFDHETEITSEEQARRYYKDQPQLVNIDQISGIIEGFDESRVSYHLGDEWSEDKLMPLRAPMWISIMNKHGYQIDKLSARVEDVLGAAGVVQIKKSTKKMKVGIFYNSITDAGRYPNKVMLMNNFKQGVLANGDEVVEYKDQRLPQEKLDAGFILGYSNKDTFRKMIIDSLKSQKTHRIFVDSNILGYAKNDNVWHRYSLDSVYPTDGIYFFNRIDKNKWDKFSGYHSVSLKNWRRTGTHILILCQRPAGWNMFEDQFVWLKRIVEQIRKHSKRPIVVRLHPNDKTKNKQSEEIKKHFGTRVHVSTNDNILDDLKDCWCAVGYNSTPNVVSAIEGIPIYLEDPMHSWAADVALTNIASIENPFLADRSKWIHKIANIHWSNEEVNSGKLWAEIKNYISSVQK